MKNKYNAGSLFSGIGGFCLGFKKHGIKTVWAVENDPASLKTYEKNVKNVRVVKNQKEPTSIKNVSVAGNYLEPVDVLHAGFPCQSFSQAGQRNGFEDDRGKLFFEIIRIIREFKDKKPSVLVLENTPHLRSGDGGTWFIEIKNQIKKAGYWFRDSNSAELDTYELTALPQRRKRLLWLLFL